MRIVYLNVGETDELIGLYPYGPMHHMRVVFEKLDPRQDAPTQVDREAALQEIMEAFNAIREHFLDEFDLVEPAKPILIYKMRRSKRSGATAKALALHDRQADLLKRLQQNG
jgi:hypothetical protein